MSLVRGSRRLLLGLGVSLVVLGWGVRGARAGTGHCHSSAECAPWAVCSVELGDCGAGDSPLAVCTGRCVTGRALRLDLRAGALATSLTEGAERDVGLAVGLELVLPFWRGHLAVAADYLSAGLGRLGLVVGVPVGPGVVPAVRVDWLAGADAATGSLALRLELAPWWPWPGITPFHYVSLYVEGGAWIDAGGAAPFAGVGLTGWPPAIP